jgi:hypothetical protein
VDPHRLAEARSLAMHRVIAERLRGDPRWLERARERVAGWMAQGRSPYYAAAWQRLLESPIEEICAMLVADTEEARALRQATPFAGAIGPRERWSIWARVRDTGSAG